MTLIYISGKTIVDTLSIFADFFSYIEYSMKELHYYIGWIAVFYETCAK